MVLGDSYFPTLLLLTSMELYRYRKMWGSIDLRASSPQVDLCLVNSPLRLFKTTTLTRKHKRARATVATSGSCCVSPPALLIMVYEYYSGLYIWNESVYVCVYV